jgi:hypothetical protein
MREPGVSSAMNGNRSGFDVFSLVSRLGLANNGEGIFTSLSK